jgi:hypothetical protein
MTDHTVAQRFLAERDALKCHGNCRFVTLFGSCDEPAFFREQGTMGRDIHLVPWRSCLFTPSRWQPREGDES